MSLNDVGFIAATMLFFGVILAFGRLVEPYDKDQFPPED